MRSERSLLRLTPRARGRSWKSYVLGSLALIIVGPFVLAYKLFFGWWLGPLLDWHYEKKLRERVRTDLAFLFLDFDGRFVANERTDQYATFVTVEAADMRLVISQHHGDYGISVARRDAPEKNESLESILAFIYEKEGPLHRPTYVTLEDLGRLLREKFNQVQMALSEERFPDTVAAGDRINRQQMQRMAQGFNKPGGLFDADVVNLRDIPKKVSK